MNDVAKFFKLRRWAADIEDWQRSGLTQTAWAEVHGISRYTWHYRKRQVEQYMAKMMEKKSEMRNEPVNRLPKPQQIVPVQSALTTDYCIEVELEGGTVRLSGDVTSELIQTLIREVKNA